MLSFQVDRRGGELVGRRITEQADIRLAPIALRIKDSLYASLDRAGESPALVMMIVDIFAWDIDFYIDTYQGDEIRLLVEKLSVDGEFVRYGQILAAEYRGQVGVHRAFRYETDDGKVGYYDQDGGSLRKAFLKSPLKFTRISSGFGNRVHPILGFSKMHLGIDLAAPRGTPIWAPADGSVVFSGRKGVSGNLVVLRHANGYQTVFAHLHTIASAVRKGSRVIQKQVIGTVGSTGRSTGPHLHYGMKKDGRHVNPFRQRFPPADPVPASQMKTFLRAIAPLIRQLEAIQLPQSTRTAAVTSERKDAG
jgi:murein DD-endopeptidase MepM/ murein hydrolase activator NlpD